MSNHSNESSTYPCQKCLGKKTIYLTFDDGPEPGTLDIYNKLNDLGVPATFFMVGENVIASEMGNLNISNMQSIASGFFKQVFDNALFEIGNHSQTQSHQFYESFYDAGLRINTQTLSPNAQSSLDSNHIGRRSVLVDFELASVAFTHALSGNPEKYFEDRLKIAEYSYRGDDVSSLFSQYEISYFRFLTSRMPGTPRWRLPNKKDTAWDWLRDSADRDDEADDLFTNNHRVYSWDLEWHMDGGSTMSPDVRQEHLDGKDGWWDHYYSESHKDKDRPEESVQTLFNQTKSHLNGWTTGGQCVILMHDRQFRSNPDGSNPYIELLSNFIEKCKDEGFEFDILENY